MMNDPIESKSFVTLDVFENIWTAEIVKFRLIEEGIEAYIIDPNINYSFGPTNIEGFRLQVDHSQITKAINIYKNTLLD